MTFSQSVSSAFRHYVDFNGRASRSEFWYYALFVALIYFAAWLLSGSGAAGENGNSYMAGVLQGVVGLVLLLPSLSMSVRRMHDIGKGGGWIFIWLLPLVGEIWFVLLALRRGQPGVNRFGMQPL